MQRGTKYLRREFLLFLSSALAALLNLHPQRDLEPLFPKAVIQVSSIVLILTILISMQIWPLRLHRDDGFIIIRPTGIEIEVTAQVLSTEVVTESLITFLTNKHGARFRLIFHITSASSRIYIKYSEKRWFPSVFRVKQEISALLSTYHITLNFDVELPKTGNHFVKDPLALPSLERLVTDLVLMQPMDLVLAMDYSFRTKGCSLRCSFGMDKIQRQSVKAILSSYGTNLHRRKSWARTSSEDVWRLLRFQPLSSLPNSVDLLTPDEGELSIGKKLLNGNEYADLKISVEDFRMGGVITGAIGQGKTNLRLHIVHYLLSSGVRVLDFDLKGDLARYPSIRSQAKILIPKVNFRINIFAPPPNLDSLTYAELIFTSLVQTMGDDISAPQLYLLEKAVTLTVTTGGNPFDFFFNILAISEGDKSILDTRQDATALALITRLNWMKGSMRDIFWTDSNSFSEEILEGSVIFDLSVLNQSTPMRYIRLLIEIILMRIISTKVKVDMPRPKLHTLISIDEGQLLIPKNKSTVLTKLEEIVTTMRYQGIAVLVAGVHEDMMSSVLLDTGFNARFRSFNEESNLRAYQCLIRKESSGYQVIEASIKKFFDTANFQSMDKLTDSSLPDFLLDKDKIEAARSLSKFPNLLSLPFHKRNQVFCLLDNLDIETYIQSFQQGYELDSLIKIIHNLALFLSNFISFPSSYLMDASLYYLVKCDVKTLKRVKLHDALIGKLSQDVL